MTSKHLFQRLDLELADSTASKRDINRDLKRILDAKSVVLDVGANSGQFARQILDVIPDVSIFSFEPVLESYNALVSVVEKYHQITPVKQAIALKNGHATFFVTSGNEGSSLLEPLPNQPSKWLTVDKQVTVETIRLDDFLRQNNLATPGAVGLLKSDAQGSDHDVLLSAGDFLNPKHIKSILVEINFATFYKGQQHYYDIFSLLDKAGYRMAWMYPNRAHDEWLWWADVLFIGK